MLETQRSPFVIVDGGKTSAVSIDGLAKIAVNNAGFPLASIESAIISLDKDAHA